LQNRCHTFLDCRHVCRTCAFHDALQVGKQKEVHPPYSPDLAPVGVLLIFCTCSPHVYRGSQLVIINRGIHTVTRDTVSFSVCVLILFEIM
jgi:hypothetical protein